MSFKIKRGEKPAENSKTSGVIKPAPSSETVTTSDSSTFAERTRVTGFAPPPRTMTFTNVLAEERIRAKTMARIGKVLAVLCVPLTAAGVFYFLNSQEDPSAKSHTPPPRPKIAVAVKAAPVVVAQATPVVPVAPTAEAATRPLIPFSSKPADRDQLPAITRENAGFFLNREEVNNLRNLLTTDPSARALAAQLKKQADDALTRAPHPTETFNAKSPAESAFISLAEGDIEDVRRLHHAIVIFNQPEYVEHLKKHLMAWAQTYKALGNAPVDVRLSSLFASYPVVSARMSEEERKTFETWMLLVGDRQVTEAVARGVSNDAWFAFHLETMTYVGFLTGNGNFQAYVKLNFATHLASAIRENGSTAVFTERDSISAHLQQMQSLLKSSRILLRAGRADKESLPMIGSAFARGIDFAMPFLTGSQTHQEFANVTDPDFHRRQLAREPGYASRPFQTIEGVEFLEAASFFRPSLNSAISAAYGVPSLTFASTNSLLNAVTIRKTADFESPQVVRPQVTQSLSPQIPAQPLAVQAQQKQAAPPAPAPAVRQPATPQH